VNRTKIEWTDFTWNPQVGCNNFRDAVCAVGDKCWARRQAKRMLNRCRLCYDFVPHLHVERLNEPYNGVPKNFRSKNPHLPRGSAMIFVVSMGDLFCRGVPNEWIEQILKVVKDNKHLIFQFLTKNPSRYANFDFPKNCWLGTTVNRSSETRRIKMLSQASDKNIKFVSFEPLYEKIVPSACVDWIIIGAQTNPCKLPKLKWVTGLISMAKKMGACVFLKDNLLEGYPMLKPIREFPEVVF